jgi:spermidine synthase
MTEAPGGVSGAPWRTFTELQLPALVGGFAVMGAEMAFARQAAPWFGSSLPVWAVLISVLLLALAVGSWWGGQRSLRGGSARLPGRLLVVAGGGLLLAAVLMPPLLAGAARARALGLPLAVASALGALGLAGLPLLALGALPPALVASWVGRQAPAGLAAGRLSALATAGSLGGTLGTAFVLLPWLGTRATVLALAAACLLTALPGARRPGRATALALLLAAAGAGAAGPGTGAWPVSGRLLEARQSAYHAAFVLEEPGGTRTLRLNSLQEPHSHHDPRGPTTIGVWPYFLLAQALRPGCARPPRRVLVLGLGAGTLARDLGFAFPGSTVVGVEIDPAVVELGRRWFALPDTTEVHVQDGRRFLNQAAADPAHAARYDLVLVDAFNGPYIPFQLATRESFERISTLLSPGGALAVDVLSFPQDPALEAAVARTMATVFDRIQRAPVRPGYNSMLIASRSRDEAPTAAPCALPRHPAQRAFLTATLPQIQRWHDDHRAPILTDDHAPIEWLTHRSAWSALRGQRPADHAP